MNHKRIGQLERRMDELRAPAPAGRPGDEPPELTAEQRAELDAKFAGIDPDGAMGTAQRVRLAPYAGVIAQFLAEPAPPIEAAG